MLPRDLRERADASVRRLGLGAKLLATSNEARAGCQAGGTLPDYSAFLFRAQVTVYRLGAKRFKGRTFNVTLLSKRRKMKAPTNPYFV